MKGMKTEGEGRKKERERLEAPFHISGYAADFQWALRF